MFTRLLIGGIICTPIVIAAATRTNSQAERERNPETTAEVVSRTGVSGLALNPPTVTLVGPSSKNVNANSQNNEAMFFVENNNATSQNYTLTCGRTSAVTACTPVPSSISLDGYEQIDVSVLYNVGSSGTGMVWLVAGGKRDTLNVTVVPSDTAGAPIVDVANVNPGTLLDRSSCVTSAAGAVGAFQCGELLLAHSMPAFKSLNRDRTFTLLYNGATARVHPIIMADISLGAGILTPDSVKATVTIGGINRVTRWFSAASLSTSARRIALGFDAAAAGFSTGVYVYTLEVSNYYGSTPKPAQVTGDLIVTNRRASPYGAGWAPAGVEQLFPGQRNGAVLLVGGDGSAAVYEGIATNTWLAPIGAFRDTLWYDGSSYYRRELDKTMIFYNGSGLQTRVADRIGNEVQYTYRSSSDPGLLSVKIAPVTANKQYLMSYDAYSRIAYITDPANRVLGLTVNGSGDLTHARDPGFTTDIVMGYDADHRLKNWTSRRGGRSSFVYYDATALLLRDTMPAPASGPGIRNFTAAQTRGYGASATGLNFMVASANSTVYVDGPRTDEPDVASFSVNKYGAPLVITDAFSNSTIIRYSAAAPLLPDSIWYPNGRSLRFTYDASARTRKSEDLTHSSGTQAVVDYRYNYNSFAPESPDTIILPFNGSQRDVIKFTYNANGTLAEIKDARDHRTTFEQNTFGQDTAVIEQDVPGVWISPGNLATQDLASYVSYDALGNPRSTKTPLGHVTTITRDTEGRVQSIKAPDTDSVGFRHTPMNWQDTIFQYAPGRTDTTTLEFDADGNRTKHCDPRGICRSWTHDLLGRVLTMTDELGRSEEHRYDAAGNAKYFRDRNGDTITSLYDRMNRLTNKYIGQVTADSEEDSVRYGVPIGTVIQPADQHTFSHDVLGRVTRAETHSTITQRAYTKEGAIARDSQYIKSPINQTFLGIYAYQPSGARYTYATGARTYTYSYGAGGVLDQVSWSGGSATMAWDALGRRSSVTLPNGHVTQYQYDADGRTRRAVSSFNSTTLFDRVYSSYDGAGRPKEIHDTGYRFSYNYLRRYMEYDGRGQLLRDRTEGVSTGASWNKYDRSGNREWAYANCSPTWTACGDTTEYTYYDGTNRIGRVATWTAGGPVHTQHTYIYDRNGTVTLDHWFDAATNQSYKLARYHDPAGRMGSTNAVSAPSNLYFAYDAFGRKVRGAIQSSTAWMFYDGENTVRFRDHEFLHWPELDAPLIAFFASGSNITCNDAYTSAYVVTVGNRLLDYHSSGTGMSCFGNTSGEYQAWTSVGRHAGAIRDSETFNLERSPGGGSGTGALSFFRNRWYDANTGRFTQEDPIGFAGGVNLYAYAGNNPATYTDPFGLCPPENNDFSDCGFTEQGLQSAGLFDPVALLAGGIAGGVRSLLARAFTRSAVPTASNPALQRTISALFRPGDKIAGGTAGAIRHEAITGNPVGGRFHLQKGIERISNLQNILKRQEFSPADRALAERLLKDLQDAVSFAQDAARKAQ